MTIFIKFCQTHAVTVIVKLNVKNAIHESPNYSLLKLNLEQLLGIMKFQ